MYLSTTKTNTDCLVGSCLRGLLQSCLILLCLAITAGNANAQQRHKPVAINASHDKIEYQGFIIRLIPTLNGHYGFDILKQGTLLLHQTQSPLPNISLEHKEDAFITAKWLVKEYREKGHFPKIFPPNFENQFSAAHPR